ncbi:MAG TPA: LamG domain-containing protein, partial [Nitrosopumilaceae archaeon]|nr:LamG domain-containing protein [Nitrosopumilaceae archaeon]
MNKLLFAWFVSILCIIALGSLENDAIQTLVYATHTDENERQYETKPSDILDEILSWYFLNLKINTLTIFGDIKMQDGFIGNTLDLDGINDYLVVHSTSDTNQFKSMTLSAWVKPNYTRASHQLTVISKDKAFEVSILNQKSNSFALFSVYDGMKWVTVKSTSPISEEWTNIIATYYGSTLSIYVNGNLEATKKLSNIPLYYVNGKASTKSVLQIGSNADIIIGAAQSKSGPTNLFTGQIDEVQFYITPTLIQSGEFVEGPIANVTEAIPANVTEAIPANVTEAIPANVTEAIPAN